MRKVSSFKFQVSSFRNGFTIIELLVAMGIFIILLGIVVGIFVGALRNQRSIVALMAANDNASLALEQMAREIRTGSNFNVSNPGALSFINAYGDSVTYQLNSSTNAIERQVGSGNPLPITGNNVKITTLRFYDARPVPLDSSWPWRITVTLGVGFTGQNLQSVVNNIQTTVSAREI